MLYVSIHGLLRALTGTFSYIVPSGSFNPRALTSPDEFFKSWFDDMYVSIHGLLRALTQPGDLVDVVFNVSIHGLLRALTHWE